MQTFGTSLHVTVLQVGVKDPEFFTTEEKAQLWLQIVSLHKGSTGNGINPWSS